MHITNAWFLLYNYSANPVLMQLVINNCSWPSLQPLKTTAGLLKSVPVHFVYGSDGRSFFVEYS